MTQRRSEPMLKRSRWALELYARGKRRHQQCSSSAGITAVTDRPVTTSSDDSAHAGQASRSCSYLSLPTLPAKLIHIPRLAPAVPSTPTSSPLILACAPRPMILASTMERHHMACHTISQLARHPTPACRGYRRRTKRWYTTCRDTWRRLQLSRYNGAEPVRPPARIDLRVPESGRRKAQGGCSARVGKAAGGSPPWSDCSVATQWFVAV